jgi:hypothetical protein
MKSMNTHLAFFVPFFACSLHMLLCRLTQHNAEEYFAEPGTAGLVTRADDGRSALAIRPSVVPRLVEATMIVPRSDSASDSAQYLLLQHLFLCLSGPMLLQF